MNEGKPQDPLWPCRTCGAKNYADARNLCAADFVCAADAQRILETEEFPLTDPRHRDTKPLLGIMPERMWKELRVWDLVECLARHHGQPSVPDKWFCELRRLLNELREEEEE